jgi:hypothetical protein
MLSLLPKDVHTKYLKVFHLPMVYPQILVKFKTALIGYSGAWGKLIHEKNLKSKISWQCLFGVAMVENKDIREQGKSELLKLLALT